MADKNGVINVYKEGGVTSFHVVARIRKIFNIKKVGHTGTLDPMAEGVLPICVGSATRFAELLTAGDKQYITNFRMGKSYDSFDITGSVKKESLIKPERDEINAALQSMIGETELTVPAFSAKKIDGKRAYELARKGKLEDAGRAVMHIKRIELVSYDYPDGVFVVDCGKGTYVRSIINEMGIKTGAYAAMSGLIRSQNGPFHMSSAKKLDDIEKELANGAKLLTPVQDVLDLPKFAVCKGAAERIMNGISPKYNEYSTQVAAQTDAMCLILDENGKLLALGEFKGGNIPIKLSKVFNS